MTRKYENSNDIVKTCSLVQVKNYFKTYEETKVFRIKCGKYFFLFICIKTKNQTD